MGSESLSDPLCPPACTAYTPCPPSPTHPACPPPHAHCHPHRTACGRCGSLPRTPPRTPPSPDAAAPQSLPGTDCGWGGRGEGGGGGGQGVRPLPPWHPRASAGRGGSGGPAICGWAMTMHPMRRGRGPRGSMGGGRGGGGRCGGPTPAGAPASVGVWVCVNERERVSRVRVMQGVDAACDGCGGVPVSPGGVASRGTAAPPRGGSRPGMPGRGGHSQSHSPPPRSAPAPPACGPAAPPDARQRRGQRCGRRGRGWRARCPPTRCPGGAG